MRPRNGMGMPCVGARYLRPTGDSHALEEGARCAACGAPATDCHHVPPKGAGGRPGEPLGGVRLRPALVALCHGCHMDLHQRGAVSVRWEWDRPESRWDWEDGLLSQRVYEEPSLLFRWGRWEVDGPRGARSLRSDGHGNWEEGA